METPPPATPLEERAGNVAADGPGVPPVPSDVAAGQTVELRFGYRVCGVGFLVGRGVASEVLSAPPVFPFPRMPSRLRGFVNLRGVIVPVLDLAAVVTGNATGSSGRFMIVLDGGTAAIAIPIDNLPVTLGRLRPSAGTIACPPHLREFVRGVMLDGRQHWHELDHRALTQQAVSD